MGIMPDANGILDVKGSYDGSWMTRGHRSHIGVGCFIDMETGFVLDCEILSNFCLQCSRLDTQLKKKSITEEQHTEKMRVHKPNCAKNFHGKSGAMEAEAAVRIWSRSIQKNKMRYVTFIGDGDSSAYRAVSNLKPYGDIQVHKEECINHVSKRLGTQPRKLREKSKVTTGRGRKRSTLGGRNKLTDKVLDKLPFYYGQAVRRNTGNNVEGLRNDIIATFYHCTSTDENPRHDHCPPGEKSWCFYRRAEAKGDIPASHKAMKVKFTLDPPERKQVLQVYMDLTKDDLLIKCMMGKTQNPNEALHGKIWSNLHKIRYFGLKTVTYNVRYTVLQHNVGYLRADLSKELGFEGMSVFTEKGLQAKDKMRKRSSEAPKRPSKRAKKASEDDYAAGSF